MFLPLAKRNGQGELEGRLAESWEHTPQDHMWTIRRRDGMPVTAHDIKFTIDLLTHPDVRWYPPNSYAVEIVDDLTYRIRYKQNGLAASVGDDWQVYYPKHILEKLDPKAFMNWDFWKHPVGNGPY